MIICNRNKNYMKYWLFWWLNFGTLKQFMMTMPFLTSIQLCLNSLSSDLHLPILLLFLGNQLKAETVRLAISPHPVQQSRIWLNCPAAEKNPGILRKRNFLVSVKTTDFEKTIIQAHSALPALGGNVGSWSHIIDTTPTPASCPSTNSVTGTNIYFCFLADLGSCWQTTYILIIDTFDFILKIVFKWS